MDEPRIALAASPREWAQRLHRHVADHGGARVRATVLQPRDALEEDYDVFVADDTTSFLTPRLVGQLRERGRGVLGVFDPGDPHGRDELLATGVDEVLARDAPPEAFVEALRAVRAALRAPVHEPEGTPGDGRGPAPAGGAGSGRTTAVTSACAGAGATELAVALATTCGRRGEATVLVDADDVAPALAPRLGLPSYPNLRAAVDAVEQRGAVPPDHLVTVERGRFLALPGPGSPAGWNELRPAQAGDVVRALASAHRRALVNVSHRIEDLPASGGPPRYGLARHLLGSAGCVVAVTLPTPPGIARLFDWVADLRAFAPRVPLHVVCNRAPASPFKRAEVTGEITRTLAPAGLWFTPADARVDEAVWRQEVVTAGAFARAVAALAAATMPARRGGGRRLRGNAA